MTNTKTKTSGKTARAVFMTGDQFDTFFARITKRKEEILEIAEQGLDQPKDDTALGAFLKRCIDVDDEYYDLDFALKLVSLAPPSWRLDKDGVSKAALNELVEQGRVIVLDCRK